MIEDNNTIVGRGDPLVTRSTADPFIVLKIFIVYDV